MGQGRTRLGLNPDWSERYLGGTPETEAELFTAFARQIQEVQGRNRKWASEPIRRAFHAKILAGIVNARFVVASDVRPELQVGLFVPRASYPALVRLSNASGMVRRDLEKDLRGVAARVQVGDGVEQDFLMSNAQASHACDANQFMVAAVAMAGGRRITALPSMILKLGLREGLRVIKTLKREASRPVGSVATEAFWSRAPYAVGTYAWKFKFEPLAAAVASVTYPENRDALREEFAARLLREDVRYTLRAIPYRDEASTPIEDGTVAWPEEDPPPEDIAELVIPRQDLRAGEGPENERRIEALQFSPWNAAPGIRPIGGLNRARRPVYQASARYRSQPT
jgi:hypothetical protein